MRIAGEHVKFGESFVKLGIVPGDGGAWLLPRVVGWSQACEMALTGDLVNAEEAKAIALVSRIVPQDKLMETARDVALRIAANPSHAVRLTKRLLRKAGQQSLSEILETSAAYQALAHATADHEEAVVAMLEKRSPRLATSSRIDQISDRGSTLSHSGFTGNDRARLLISVRSTGR